MHRTALWAVAILPVGACTAPAGDHDIWEHPAPPSAVTNVHGGAEHPTIAFAVAPPSAGTIGSTSSAILAPGPQAYWRLGDGIVLPPSGDFPPMTDSSGNSPGINGEYSDVILREVGAIAGDPDTGVRFNGDAGSLLNGYNGSYAHVDSHKVLSLTRTWDYFDQHDSDFSGKDWGVNPRGEHWTNQVTDQDDYGVRFGYEVNVTPDLTDGVAFIYPDGASGSFQQGLPSTTLLTGEMQIRALWNQRPQNGTLQPVSLVAQQIDVHNHVRAELVEHSDGHTLEIDIIKVVNGQNTYLATQPLDPSFTYELGDWVYLRFRFDGASYYAKAWKMGADEPDWQAFGTADSAVTGSVAVRSANSTGDARPTVYFNDFWVQTTGFTVAYFIKMPNVAQPGDEVYALSKAAQTGSYGQPYANAVNGPNGDQEYYFRVKPNGIPGHYKVQAYAFNLEGGYGAGINAIDDVVPDKWYYVVMELDPGDYNDPNAGIRVYQNGRWQTQQTEHYKNDGNCPGNCKLNGTDNQTTCGGQPVDPVTDNLCWLITPLSSNAPLELGRGEKGTIGSNAKYFIGSEDELAIYAKGLSCDEMANVYNASCQTADSRIPSGLFATASSYAAPNDPARAVDGSPYTHWTSAGGGNQSFTVDLGSVRDIAKVHLVWNTPYATDYQILVSSDNFAFAVAATISAGDGGTDDIPIAATARFVRMNATAGATTSGYELFEFQVLACDVAPVSCVNDFPVAIVGLQQIAFPGEVVHLDGSKSYDPEGTTLTYKWVLSVPTGSAASLASTTTATTTFVPDITGVFSATLTVTDSDGATPASSYPATTVVTVIPPGRFVSTELSNDIALAQSLTSPDVTNAGNRQAFVNFLSQARSALGTGKVDIAIKKVSSAIERTDGWSLRGRPDAHEPGRDWIVGQGPAEELYRSLTLTLAALNTL